MKPITSKQEFLLFMARRHAPEGRGGELTGAHFKAWSDIYDQYLSQFEHLKNWKQLPIALVRFFLVGLVVTTPAAMLLGLYSIYKGIPVIDSIPLLIFALQFTYAGLCASEILEFTFRKGPKDQS